MNEVKDGESSGGQVSKDGCEVRLGKNPDGIESPERRKEDWEADFTHSEVIL